MGLGKFISGITRSSPPEQTMEGEHRTLPPAVAELVLRKQRVLKDRLPKPGSPEAAIAERFDRQIQAAWEEHERSNAEASGSDE